MKKTIDEKIKIYEEVGMDFEKYAYYQPWIDYRLGKLYDEKGEKEKSTKLYEKALEHAEKEEGYVIAAMCAKKLGLEEKAKYLYEKIPEEYKKYYKI